MCLPPIASPEVSSTCKVNLNSPIAVCCIGSSVSPCPLNAVSQLFTRSGNLLMWKPLEVKQSMNTFGRMTLVLKEHNSRLVKGKLTQGTDRLIEIGRKIGRISGTMQLLEQSRVSLATLESDVILVYGALKRITLNQRQLSDRLYVIGGLLERANLTAHGQKLASKLILKIQTLSSGMDIAVSNMSSSMNIEEPSPFLTSSDGSTNIQSLSTIKEEPLASPPERSGLQATFTPLNGTRNLTQRLKKRSYEESPLKNYPFGIPLEGTPNKEYDERLCLNTIHTDQPCADIPFLKEKHCEYCSTWKFTNSPDFN